MLTEAMVQLRTLSDGWDGPGSQPVPNRALFLAEGIIRDTLEGRPNATAPFLVPGGDGSIQIEWHEKAGEIELSIDANGQFYVWGRSHVSGQEFEGEGEEALHLFARWAPRLSAEVHDVVDVPAPEEEIYAVAA
jgi:hypothetical protein